MTMRVRTTDLAGDFHTVESVGRTREITPEGYLLCRDVKIARTGEMFYGPDELPELEPGRDGIIRATRGEDDLFDPKTIASFNGKPVTLEHPDDDVSPDSWNELAVGIVLNPRRGEGADNQFLVADLLITNKAAIQEINSEDGRHEVSNGYDAEYEQTGPGKARQFDIIGNHVALVDQGRCGPRCAIGDSDMKTQDATKASWKDRIRRAFKNRDEAALTEAMDKAQDEMTNGVDGDGDGDGDGGTTHRIVVEVKGPADNSAGDPPPNETQDDGEEAPPAWFKKFSDDITGRLEKLEAGRTSDAGGDPPPNEDEPRATEDEDELNLGQTMDEGGESEEQNEQEAGGSTRDRRGTRDSVGLKAELQDFKSRAEILVPGVKIPTFDAKDPAKRTTDRLCAMRRRILAKAYDDAETHDTIAPLFGATPNFKAMTCDGARLAFNAAAELVKSANSSITSTGFVHDGGQSAGPATLSDINKRNREFWQSKGGLKA